MAVVMEKRIVFSLEDLRSLVIKCVQCDGEVSPAWRRDTAVSRALELERCPHCHNSWKSSEDNTSLSEDRKEAIALIQAIAHFTSGRYLGRVPKKEVKWKFLFVLPGDPD